MKAHRLVLAAAALTTLVTAALASALAVFAGQALPQAAHRDLAASSGTSVNISGPVSAGQAGTYRAGVAAAVRTALHGVPAALYQAVWSDPLSLAGTGKAGLVRARLATPGNTPLVQAAAFDALPGHAALVAGHWPAAPRPGQPIQAAVPQVVASAAHLAAGDLLTVRDQISGRPVRFVISGTFRQTTPGAGTAGYWGLNTIGRTGSSTSGGFTTYGPLAVSPAAFGSMLGVNSAVWVAQPQTGRIPDGDLTTVAASVSALRQSLPNSSSLSGLQVSTSLPEVLGATAANLAVARSLLVIGALELALVAVAALAAAATFLANRREAESALLASRGATRGQLARLNVAEALVLCVTATAVGGLGGGWLAGLLASAGPLRAAGLHLPVLPAGAWWVLPVTAAGALVIMLWPTLRTLSPGAARRRRGRQAAVPGIARAGVDVALVALAILTGWQLRHYSAVASSANGPGGIDPVIALAPALALAGGTAVTLRLLPSAARIADRLASRGRRLGPALSCWQLSRRPLSQAGGALLIVMAVATGTLALSQHRSWVRSEADQAAFGAGADVRVDLPDPLPVGTAGRIAATPGVREAMPAAVIASSGSGETLAVDTRKAAGVTLLRADQSPVPATALFGAVGQAVGPAGVTLPGHPAAIQLTASFGPASLRLAPAVVTVSVEDADGGVYQVPAGSLRASGQPQELTADLGTGGPGKSGSPGGSGEASYPLRLTAITASYTLPAQAARAAAVFTVHDVAVPGGSAPGTALSGWTASVSSAEVSSLRSQSGGMAGPSALPGGASWHRSGAPGGTDQQLSFDPGYGLSAGPSPAVPPAPVYGQLSLTDGAPGTAALPAIATRGFLAANSVGVGSTVEDAVDGATIPVKIVAAVTSFPTVPAAGGGLVVDLASLQQFLIDRSLPPVPVTQWWLATGSAGAPPGLAARLPAGTAVTTRAGLADDLLGDPVSAAPQQAVLAVAGAAALLAIAGFFVSIATGISQRRSETALLAALGVPARAQAGQLCVTELLLSLPSALAGLVLGAVVTVLLVPAVTLTPAATAPVPPALTAFAWSQALPLALAIALLPVLAAAAAAARPPDPAASLRTAESA